MKPTASTISATAIQPRPITSMPQQQDQHRHGGHAVEHGAPVERADRVHAAGGEADPGHQAGADRAIEHRRVPRGRIEAAAQPPGVDDAIGGAGRVGRHRQQAAADDAQREDQRGGASRDRPQGAGGLPGARDGGLSMRVEHGRAHQHDADRYRAGDQHAGPGVERDAAPLVARGRFGARRGLVLLVFERGLPDEQVGADGGAEHRHRGGRVVVAEHDARMQQGPPGLAPVDIDQRHFDRVGQHGQRQPFHHARVARIGQAHQRGEHAEPVDGRVDGRMAAGGQGGGAAHCREVRADVDQADQRDAGRQALGQARAAVLAHAGQQAGAGAAADPRRGDLHRHHQGQGEGDQPQHLEAELAAGLAVDRDAAGVVVGRAGQQPRAEAAVPGPGLAGRCRFARCSLPGLAGGTASLHAWVHASRSAT